MCSQWRSYMQSLGSADPDKFVKNQCKSLFITVFYRQRLQCGIGKTPVPFWTGFAPAQELTCLTIGGGLSMLLAWTRLEIFVDPTAVASLSSSTGTSSLGTPASSSPTGCRRGTPARSARHGPGRALCPSSHAHAPSPSSPLSLRLQTGHGPGTKKI